MPQALLNVYVMLVRGEVTFAAAQSLASSMYTIGQDFANALMANNELFELPEKQGRQIFILIGRVMCEGE